MRRSALALFCFLSAVSGHPYEFRRNFKFRNTNLDEPAYRLQSTIQPREYHVDLDVYLEENRFNGLVQILIDVEEANVTQIVLHQKVVSIITITVLDSSNTVVPLQFPDSFETDSYYELIKINLAEPIAIGSYTLTISYLGQISENPYGEGFYKGYYLYNGETRYYATTQFQPYHAREAFPCFDEPQFKSRFVISITRPADFSQSYSNMAINQTQIISTTRVRETFLPTPLMSVYLVAFHVSDFVETTITGTPEKPFGIISRPGPIEQHRYAAEIGVAITDWMDDYFNLSYYDMGQGFPMKNDHIALPDFASGAMENWGIVTYMEDYLLFDSENTNLPSQVLTTTTVAHELAHKWFGNLVTCFWWSNLWLNESFAAFFEYFAPHSLDPTLELDDLFVVYSVHSSLMYDAYASATPMNWTGVESNPSIIEHFSIISYDKGASVLRMMEHFVRPATFQKALRYYLRDNAYGLGTPDLMYSAFRTAADEDGSVSQLLSADVGTVFRSYVQNPGAPVVTVSVDHDTGVITVSQQRFQLSGTVPDDIWQIPLTFTYASAANFEDTTPVALLTTRSATINKPAGHEWVIFNVAQSGYYRVNYDNHTWELIATALRENREVIHKLNRAQIVNDVLFYIRAGTMDIDVAFDVLSFLSQETDYYVWVGVLEDLNWLRQRVRHLPAVYDEFSAYILKSMQTAIEVLGYDQLETDSTSTILNRMFLMNNACNLGHAGCVADSLAKWRAFRDNPAIKVPKNLRRYVYCIGLREGDYSDYEFLWQQYSSSDNAADMVVTLQSLACSKDQTAVAHYLQQTISNELLIRYHDRNIAFNFALYGNPENLQTVLNFVYNHYADIRINYGGSDGLNGVFYSLEDFLIDFQDIITFHSWLYANQLNLPDEFNAGRSVVAAAIENLSWGNNVAVDLVAYLRARSGAAAAPLLATAALLVAAMIAHLCR